MRKTAKALGLAGLLYILASGCGQQGLQVELPGRKIQRVWPVDEQGLSVDTNIVMINEDRNGDGMYDVLMFGIDVNNDKKLTEEEVFEPVFYSGLARQRGLYPLKVKPSTPKSATPAPVTPATPVQEAPKEAPKPAETAQPIEEKVADAEKIWDNLDSLEGKLPKAAVLFSSGNAAADNILMRKFQNLAAMAYKAGVKYNEGKSEETRMNLYFVKEGRCYPVFVDDTCLEIVLGDSMDLAEMYDFEKERLNRAIREK